MRPEMTRRSRDRTTRSGLFEKEPQDGRAGCAPALARRDCIVGTPALRGNSERKNENSATAMGCGAALHQHRVADEADGKAFDLERLARLDDDGGVFRVFGVQLDQVLV